MSNTSLSKVVLLLVMCIGGCTVAMPQSLQVTAALIPAQELPAFTDDLELDGLAASVQGQLAVLRREGDREGLRIGPVRFRTRHLLASLEHFSRLLDETKNCLNIWMAPERCHEALAQQIREDFLVYRLDASLLTGYYTPTIHVSTERTELYRYPIYRTPATAREQRLSREAIDFANALDGKGYELYYAADRFDLYVMHIEGGARVVVHDRGRTYTRYLHYHADNGRTFRLLEEYMLQHGMLRHGRRSRWDQRNYLVEHPDKARPIFSSCPGYVFFKVSDIPPITSTGIPLTANRSLATDPVYYPVKGVITYVVAPIPELPAEDVPAESNPKGLKYRTMRRFFIDQDVGHMITGPARGDLFFGEGRYAEFLANNFLTRGTVYLLISK